MWQSPELVSELCVALQEEGAAAWEPAPRVTEADRHNDRQSPWRRLDRRLYFLVKGSGLSPWRLTHQCCSPVNFMHTV